jgi:hypothetical protein
MTFDIVSWPTLVLALVVFGFAPGLVLRLIVLAFPRDDPRRKELLGELHAVPRFERPFWVAEQLEVALVEGLAPRLPVVVRVVITLTLTMILSARLVRRFFEADVRTQLRS